ncbi:MAG: DUF4249 family protein [Bacteroidetes bacterium]|nr:DUF4249 family protein [Bacteroidota bacterium]
MKKSVSNIVLSAFLLGISSCITTEIPNSELPEFVNKLVVNASFDNLNNMSVQITNSAGAYTTDLPQVINDADLELTNYDGKHIFLTYDPVNAVYTSPQKALPGEYYTLVVSNSTYPVARANCNIPAKVKGKVTGYIEDGGIDMDGSKSDKVYIRFQDEAGSNFYVLHFFYYSKNANLFIPFEFETTDHTLNSGTTLKLNDGGYLFDDTYFDGTLKEFSAVPTSGLVAGNPDVKYLVELRSVSKDYYLYYKTLKQYQDNQDKQNNGPFSSAIIVHSNIVGGLGIFMGSTLESDTLR